MITVADQCKKEIEYSYFLVVDQAFRLGSEVEKDFVKLKHGYIIDGITLEACGGN